MDYLTDKNWIEKSRTLIYAEWSKFDIYELQIFETYLSRINPRDTESSCVRFTRNEYAKMMGYADSRNLKTRTLNKWVKNFINKQISINYEGGTRHINLFSDADVHLDSETGEIVIDLECNYKFKPVFFDIAEKGYISYRRRNTINFKSEYTLKLYCMLKDHTWGKYEWIVEVKELRNMLGATEKLYEKFPEFNRRILKKAKEEINGHTDIGFTYEKITRGRLTRAIKFKIEEIKKADYKDDNNFPGQNESELENMDIQELQSQVDEDRKRRFNFWTEACDGEFSQAQMEELVVLAREHVTAPEQSEQYELDIYHYLQRKYKALNAKDQSEIKNRYGYLKWLVENENRQEKEKTNKKETAKKNRFNNFPQRTYDYDELERMLLTTTID